jgi:hypothetical protein
MPNRGEAGLVFGGSADVIAEQKRSSAEANLEIAGAKAAAVPIVSDARMEGRFCSTPPSLGINEAQGSGSWPLSFQKIRRGNSFLRLASIAALSLAMFIQIIRVHPSRATA